MNLQAWMIPSDLAPGDGKCIHADMSRIELHRIGSPDDPHFDTAFSALRAEFGEAGEIESADTLAARLRRKSPEIRYEMVLITSGGQFAAVCDHNVILQEDQAGALIHVSHNLVAPAWRRTGLAGWIRALPLATARDVLAVHGRPANSPITIIGEVEPLDHAHAGNVGRLHAYEKAGFKKIDPARVRYLQPDFRSPLQIDLEGASSPVPLCLVIRHVGSGKGEFISGAETLRIVRSLYRMFALDFRPQDMRCVYESLRNYPGPDEIVALIPPTAA